MKHTETLDSLPFLLARLDRDLRVVYINTKWADSVHSQPSELVGRTADQLGMPADQYGDWVEQARMSIAAGTPQRYTFYPAQLGSSVSYQFTPQPDGDLVVTILRCQDRSTSVAELFSRFVTHVPLIAWLRDEHGRYVYTNAGYRSATQLPGDCVGKRLSEVWPRELAEQFMANDRKVLRSSEPLETLDTVPTPDGKFRTCHNVQFVLSEADGRRYAAGLGLDLTDRLQLEDDRRALERQLLHAQKLDSLGVMAGGIAHDFNNLLTTILGNTSLARMNVSDPSPVSDCLRKVEGAAMRAAELCQQMLAYSGRGQFVIKELNLNELIQEMATMLGAVISKRAVLNFRLADSVPLIRADASQLRQVILNLITNASDAIGDTSGVITLTTGILAADAKYLNELALANQLLSGLYATLEVSDTGVGMDEATRLRIFDPFFTTKFAGRGLGLSAVQGILRGHKGAIRVYSQPGKGSTFKVLLPAHEAQLPATVSPPQRSGRGRTVLVIDDEDEVRLVMRRLLESAGFNVLLATDGVDGVNTFRNFHEQTGVVLLDLTMPRMGGAETFRELRRIQSNVKVVLTSGYGRQEALTGFEGKGLFAFLRKPFTGDDMLNVVFSAVGS